MKKNLLSKYKNGNYIVELYADGTKVKWTPDDYFDADFPDSMDIKITNCCDMNCPMCHEKSTPDGKHAVFDHKFLDTLVRGTELAIGGGNPLSNPSFRDFLVKMKNKGVVSNVTLNERHLLQNIDYVQSLIDEGLIHGLGISLNSFDDRALAFATKNQNCVLHLILGTPSMDKLPSLYNRNFKILLLGYKKFGRGINYYSPEIDEKIKETADKFDEILSSFKVVSFDNLALKQLDVKNRVPKETFEKCFMGDDGESTMYVDLVEQKFAVSSTSSERFDLLDDIRDMFAVVKKVSKN